MCAPKSQNKFTAQQTESETAPPSETDSWEKEK